ncbi:MAG: hypothetical protein P8Q14_00190 [Vicingaceae bacterium]|nr:hypothetical protein [Vicingaceae bacterium]
MEKKIVNYLTDNKVLTIATSVNNKPYCANCFYVFDEADKTLIFYQMKTPDTFLKQ